MGAPGAGAPMPIKFLTWIHILYFTHFKQFLFDLSLKVKVDTRAPVNQIIFLRHWYTTVLMVFIYSGTTLPRSPLKWFNAMLCTQRNVHKSLKMMTTPL